MHSAGCCRSCWVQPTQQPSQPAATDTRHSWPRTRMHLLHASHTPGWAAHACNEPETCPSALFPNSSTPQSHAMCSSKTAKARQHQAPRHCHSCTFITNLSENGLCHSHRRALVQDCRQDQSAQCAALQTTLLVVCCTTVCASTDALQRHVVNSGCFPAPTGPVCGRPKPRHPFILHVKILLMRQDSRKRPDYTQPATPTLTLKHAPNTVCTSTDMLGNVM